MTDTRTISQLEAEGYPWIGCECCKGTVWVPFKMIRAGLTNANFVMVAETLTELLQPQWPQSDARPTPAFPQDQIEFEFDRKVRRCCNRNRRCTRWHGFC
jgi:hypothetical protein